MPSADGPSVAACNPFGAGSKNCVGSTNASARVVTHMRTSSDALQSKTDLHQPGDPLIARGLCETCARFAKRQTDHRVSRREANAQPLERLRAQRRIEIDTPSCRT